MAFVGSTTSSTSTSSTSNGIYGISGSGIDVDSMVTKLMAGQKATDAKLTQKQTQLQWKKDAYNTIYTDISEFRKTASNYALQSTVNPKAVSTSDNGVVTAVAGSAAVNTNHSIIVNQLAAGASLTSSAAITTSGASKTTLTSQLYGGTAPTGDITVKLSDGTNSATITVKASGSINDFVSSVNSAGLNIQASYDSALDRVFLANTDTGSTTGINISGSNANGIDFLSNKLKLNVTAPTTSSFVSTAKTSITSATSTLASQFSGLPSSFSLKINDSSGGAQTITVNTATDSLNDLLGKINGTITGSTVTGSAAVSASYDAATGKITIGGTNSKTIDFSGSDSNALAFLSNNLNIGAVAQSGKDAKINLDGMDLTEAKNSFTVAGVTYTLAGVTPVTNVLNSNGTTTAKQQAATVGISTDVDKAVAAVQTFVDSYNKILGELNTYLTTGTNSNYPPLTTDQQKSMTATEIDNYNVKAKAGILYNDPTVQTMVNDLRSSVVNAVSGISGKYTSLSSIGITSGDYTEQGKLHINTDTLRTALDTDPTVLTKLFTTSSSTSNFSQEGVANRIFSKIGNELTTLTSLAGTPSTSSSETTSSLAQQIKDYTKKLSDAIAKEKTMMTKYYTDFNNMETAIQKLSSQASWFAAMTS